MKVTSTLYVVIKNLCINNFEIVEYKLVVLVTAI